MKLNKFSLIYLLVAVFAVSCEKDDGPAPPEPPRDRGEQELDDQEALDAFLETHYYNYEEFENPPAGFDYAVEIDTIAGANSDKIPLSASPKLETKNFTYEGVEYTYYVLKVREGASEQPMPKFTDSTFVAYEGSLLDRTVFDAARKPVWFDLTMLVPGFSQAITEFRGASGFEVLPDNTVEWNNDFGIGAMFLPSGLAYFQDGQGIIPSYSPIVFKFQLYGVNEADHDNDGVPSWKEDINDDRRIGNDDSDGDNIPDYRDTDDDGDFIPTREEISDEDGNIILPYPDADGDGVPDYLDRDN